ncbi:hypothetical protein SLE2022_186220 [Rubroshorea leprosula]
MLWMLNWSDLKQWGLVRSLSDHCPIMVKNEARNWGPKPFKLFNVWLQNPSFRELVENQWNNSDIRGWGGFVVKEKLKRLKNCVKDWTRNQVQGVDKHIEEAKAKIAKLDGKGESQQLSEEECLRRRDMMICLWENIQIKEDMAKQKSRKSWMKAGDANTSYFHQCIKGRWRRSEINSLSIRGKVFEGVNELKQGVAEYFMSLFTEEGWNRPVLDGVDFKKISEAERNFLTEPFLETEVKDAVWNCDGAKAPGPDGFTFGFLKQNGMWLKATY